MAHAVLLSFAHLSCRTASAPLLSWIPRPNPFVRVSFLPVICVNRITERGVVLELSCHVNPPPSKKNMPASISCCARQFFPPPDSQPHFPVKICYEGDMKRLVLLSLFIAQFLTFATIIKTSACEARQQGNNISLYYFFISALLTA